MDVHSLIHMENDRFSLTNRHTAQVWKLRQNMNNDNANRGFEKLDRSSISSRRFTPEKWSATSHGIEKQPIVAIRGLTPSRWGQGSLQLAEFPWTLTAVNAPIVAPWIPILIPGFKSRSWWNRWWSICHMKPQILNVFFWLNHSTFEVAVFLDP